MRLPSKEARELDALIRSLGYEFHRANGGHLVYTHETQGPLTLSATPGDHRWRANVMAELRRRHPELRSEKAPPETRALRRSRKRTPRKPGSLRLAPEPDGPVVRFGGELRSRFYRCQECMKPWHVESRFPATECPLCRSALILEGKAAA